MESQAEKEAWMTDIRNAVEGLGHSLAAPYEILSHPA